VTEIAKFAARVLVVVVFSGAFSVFGQSSTNPVPFIEQPLVPVSTAPAGPAFTLTVNGLGFLSTSTVNWNGSPRTTTFVSSTQLTAAISAADIASAGTASVTVVNPTPGGGTSNVQFFGVSSPATSLAFGELNVNTGIYDEAQYMITADFQGDGKVETSPSSPRS
jgi:hypothetical protein